MKKYVKLTLCGLSAMMLIAGCSKKEETTPVTTAEETTTTAAEGETTDLDYGEVSKLGEYKGLEVAKEPAEVTDEELDKRIQGILDANPEYIEITDRAAQSGDVVHIDFVGMMDGEEFEGGSGENYQLELGSGQFIDGFEDGLIGASIGAELSLNLTFPDPYPNNPAMAGKPVVFDVTVNSIEEKKEAVLDNNFVQRMSDFTTVDEFRADTLADLTAEKETLLQTQWENEVLQLAIDNSEFNLNEKAVEEQYDDQMNYYNSFAQMYGTTPETLFGMTAEQLETEVRNASEMTVKRQLLLEAIAEKEGLTVEDADREAVAKDYNMSLEDLTNSFGEEAVEETALLYKTMDFIVDNAVVK